MSELKVALFGLDGHQIHGLLARTDRVRMTAAGGLTETQAENIKGRFPDAPIYPDMDSLLAEADFDMVSICAVPRTRQTQLIIQALNAGKHVLAEKPIAVTMDDLRAVRKAVEASGMQLRTMTNMPYLPCYVGMKRLVDDGALGTIVQVFAMKSYPYQDGRPQDRNVDGGIIEQAGIHAVSFIRYVTGLDMVEVFSQETGTGNPKKGDLQMAATCAFRMSNGALATLLCNYCNPKESLGIHGNDHLRLHGTRGMVELTDGRNRRLLAIGDAPAGTYEDVEPERPYLQDYVDCLLDATPMMLTQEDTFRNTEIVVRAQESATQGVTLKI